MQNKGFANRTPIRFEGVFLSKTKIAKKKKKKKKKKELLWLGLNEKTKTKKNLCFMLRRPPESRVFGWLKKLVLKTSFSKNWFQKKKKKQRNLEGKKKPTLFTRPFCKCRPQIRADSIFFPAFFPRLVEPWLNHGSAFEKWMFLEFFLPAAPFFIFCSAKKGSLSGSVV